MAKLPDKLEIKHLSSFVSPFLFNNCPASCVVADDGRSILYKESGKKTDYELVEQQPVGTGITLNVSRYNIDATLTADELSYKAQRQQEQLELAKHQQLEDEQRSKQRKREAAAFNESLNIPFRWTPDIKVVFSGLTANGGGDGMNRRSVYHVRVLESFHDGRFVREKGDFLCGKDKSALQDYTTPDESEKESRKITCKQCIKAAERFNRI